MRSLAPGVSRTPLGGILRVASHARYLLIHGQRIAGARAEYRTRHLTRLQLAFRAQLLAALDDVSRAPRRHLALP